MTADQRGEVTRLLVANPQRSDRGVGREVGVDGKSVGRVRRELTRTGLLPPVTTRRAVDGRRRRVAATQVEKTWRPGGLAHTTARLARGEEL
jgi:hypothetical protein